MVKRIANSRAGFTLLEMLLSVGLIAVILGIGVPVYQSFQNRNDLDIAHNLITHSLRRAEAKSRAVDDDTSWGVYVTSGSVTIFKGASYLSRDTAFDEILDVSSSISFTGFSEIVFTKFTGAPSTTGTITMTSKNNEIRNITINAKGTLSF